MKENQTKNKNTMIGQLQSYDDTQQHHFVLPGQLIAMSSISNTDSNDSFLRGHGTYMEIINGQQYLYSSVVGLVQRVNKLISVQTISSTTFYRGQVGDLVVGRILSIGNGLWKVDLGSGKEAILPLQGINLPGGIQRIRTAEDKLDMKQLLNIGDIVSAEVHKVVQPTTSVSTTSTSHVTSSTKLSGNGDGSGMLRLHTRSMKYCGKLENGCTITVPCTLIPRRKSHYAEILSGMFILLYGCNGIIWIQRNTNRSHYENSSLNNKMDIDHDHDDNNDEDDEERDGTTTRTKQNHTNPNDESLLVDVQEQRRKEHVSMPYSNQERYQLARIRNAIQCLRMVQHMMTNDVIEQIYHRSIKLLPKSSMISQMLLPHNIILLTSFTRNGEIDILTK